MGTEGSFPWGKTDRGVKLTTHLRLVVKSRMVELYFHFLMYLHGVVVNKLSAAITLHLTFT
jgi:hypothetical protein